MACNCSSGGSRARACAPPVPLGGGGAGEARSTRPASLPAHWWCWCKNARSRSACLRCGVDPRLCCAAAVIAASCASIPGAPFLFALLAIAAAMAAATGAVGTAGCRLCGLPFALWAPRALEFLCGSGWWCGNAGPCPVESHIHSVLRSFPEPVLRLREFANAAAQQAKALCITSLAGFVICPALCPKLRQLGVCGLTGGKSLGFTARHASTDRSCQLICQRPRLL